MCTYAYVAQLPQHLRENIHEKRAAPRHQCYFTLKQPLVDEVNFSFKPAVYTFLFDKTREMCRQYNATLLTIRDYAELEEMRVIYQTVGTKPRYYGLGATLGKVFIGPQYRLYMLMPSLF